MTEQPPATPPAVWWSPEYQRFYALPGTPPLVEEVETRFMPSDIQPLVPDSGQAREPDATPTAEELRAGLRTLTAENQRFSRLLAAAQTEAEIFGERNAAAKRRHYPDADLGDLAPGETEQQRMCVECDLPWPCATWTALAAPSRRTVQATYESVEGGAS